jgi:hypothetical protein
MVNVAFRQDRQLCGEIFDLTNIADGSGVPIRSQRKLPLAVAYIGAGLRH